MNLKPLFRILHKQIRLTMRKITSTLLILTTLIFSCNNFTQQESDPINFIPVDAPIIIETTDFSALWNTYSQSSIWDLREDNKGLENVFQQLDQLRKLALKNNAIAATLSGKKCFFSVSVDENYHASILMTAATNLNHNDIETIIQRDHGEEATIARKNFKNIPIYSIIFSDNESILHVTIHEGIAVLSYDIRALERSLQQYLQKRSLNDSKDFRKMQATAGSYSDGTILINFAQIHRMLLSGAYSSQSDIIAQLSGFAGWSALDITARKDKVVLNGFALSDTGSILNSFNREPNTFITEKIIPSSTAVAISQNFFNGEASLQYHQKSKSFNPIEKSFSLRDNFFSWYNGKSILLIDGGSLNNIKEQTAAVFLTTDAKETYRGLKRMATATGKKHYDRTGDDGKRIIQIPSTDLMKKLFGEAYQHLSSPYFTIHNDIVVAAADLNHLLETLRKIENQDVIANEDTFQSLSPGISGNSNISMYINMQEALPMAAEMNGHLKEAIKENPDAFKHISGLTTEFSYTDKVFFTSVYATSGEQLRSRKEKGWEIKLDAKVVGQPQIVHDHLSAEKRIIAFDALNNMYYITHDGKILWKHTLSGRPMGKVHQVDAYKNNKVQFLVNTEEHLYLIDVLGRDVENFPVKLPVKATNEIAVFKYNHYRIFFAGDNQKIYCYEINGKPVKGWKNPSAPGKVSTPLQHLTYSNKDYIFACTEKGEVMAMNRRGENRIKMRSNIMNTTRSQIYVNKTNSKAPFITTSFDGKLKYIMLNGKEAQTDFGVFSNNHYFFYERFNQDRHFDFIYFDNNHVVVYDRFKNELYNKTFENQVFTEPEVILYNRKKALKFTSLSSKKCYLITNQGIDEDIVRFEATTDFFIGKLKQYGKTVVIAGNDEKLVKYIL